MMRCLFILLLMRTSFSMACTCPVVDYITTEEMDSAAAVFIGKIVSVDVDHANQKLVAIFEITKGVKTFGLEEKVTIRTNMSGASCGLKFEAGQKWYIFAHRTKDDQLYAGLCGRSVRLSRYERKVLKHIIGRKNHRRDKRRVRQDVRNYRRYFRGFYF